MLQIKKPNCSMNLKKMSVSYALEAGSSLYLPSFVPLRLELFHLGFNGFHESPWRNDDDDPRLSILSHSLESH